MPPKNVTSCNNFENGFIGKKSPGFEGAVYLKILINENKFSYILFIYEVK